MLKNDTTKELLDARMIANRLNELLHDDAYHRLQLNKEMSHAIDQMKWSENVYTRCQLAEALCRKLGSLV